MTAFEDLLFLPDAQLFVDMKSGDMVAATRAKKAIDRGSLTIAGDTLRFSGKRSTVELSPIRGVTFDGWVRVEFGSGADIRAAVFSDTAKINRAKNRELAERLRRELGGTLSSPDQDEDLQRHRAQERAAAASRAKVRMWVGGIAAVVGTVVTVISL